MSSVITPRSYLDTRNAMTVADNRKPAGMTQITVNPKREAGKEFFGEDGVGFRDVLDAINPLNHIPLVSGMLEDATGHKPSIASKLAGGALFGPIGFVASLANVIFEQQTGKDVGNSMVAALNGDTQAETQLAANEQAEETQMAAAVDAVEDAPQQFASLDTKQLSTDDFVRNAQQSMARSTVKTGEGNPNKDQAVLDLFGGSAPASASRAYEKAKLLPYLREANTTQVL